MEETVKMVFSHTTRRGWRVYHSIQDRPEIKPLVRDIYLAPDGQLPDNTEAIEVTVSSERISTNYILQLSAATMNTLKYTPVVSSKNPPVEMSILVVYTERRSDMPSKLYLSVKPVEVI